VALGVLPMFHISGVGSVLTSMMAGAKLVIGHEASPSGIAATIEEHGVTHVVLVTSLLTGLLHLSGKSEDTRLASLRTISYGAAPITDEVLGHAVNTLGCDLVQIYGLTESSGVLTALTADDHRAIREDPACHERLRSCGQARPGIDIRIIDPATGESLPTGSIGEITARTDRIMSGYWKNDQATRETLSPGGWLRTGDLGEMDSDGYLYLHDRLRDMIISGGENVYPAEVENALQWHPAVAEVAVIGVPDQRWGETVHAVVVLTEGATATEEDLLLHARSRLAHYKCPTAVSFVGSLPRNATGKVLRRELRDPYWSSHKRRVN
jgi:long-chain acyl-CoA synthetase